MVGIGDTRGAWVTRRRAELQIDNGMNSDDEAEFEASLRAGEGGIRSRDGAVETAGPASPSPGARAHFALAPRSLDCRYGVAPDCAGTAVAGEGQLLRVAALFWLPAPADD